MPQLLANLAYGADPRQALDLYLPDRERPRLFMFIHGGGWRGGDKSQYQALGEVLSGFGFAVALPNHRLAPAYPFPAPIADVSAALDCVLRYAPESGIRAEGMFLGGHSSGAHLAALLALDPRFQPEATIAGVVCISGIYDLTRYSEAAAYLGPVFGEDAEVWKAASPAQHVAVGAPPFFLAYAQHDYPGADDQAELMAARLRQVGSTAQVTPVPDRDHISILSGVRSLFDPLAIGLALFLRGASAGA